MYIERVEEKDKNYSWTKKKKKEKKGKKKEEKKNVKFLHASK